MGELGGEILTPGSDTTLGGGALQWPLPVAGTITSPQGYRTDPITGETSYHSGTDIAVPEGTPILAAADGTVTIANALDSWGFRVRRWQSRCCNRRQNRRGGGRYTRC